jgi:hypothetical protein
MDKTTRAAREILDGEMERRQVKTARLRKARLEREASPAVEVVAPSTSKVRNKPPAKAIPYGGHMVHAKHCHNLRGGGAVVIRKEEAQLPPSEWNGFWQGVEN